LSIEANRRGAARYLTAAAVLAVHAALIAALMMTWRPGTLAGSSENTVHLLFLAPVDPPKVRVVANLRRRGGGMAITVAPPVLDSAFPIAAAPGSGTKGEGSGVDWAAEARRALQAFEIRHQQPAANQSVSGGPEEDYWRPVAQHHAGDRYKTANGDWIVWINADCYEIAGAGSSAYAHVAPLTQPICRDQSGTAAQ
jgi:hypothetical protein